MRRQRATQPRHFCPYGYFQPSETQLYYLQSRYYDPTTCRFLNADAYASTGQGILGHNMFAYCLNNAVSRTDPYGTSGAAVAHIDDYDWESPTGGGGGGTGGHTGFTVGSTVGCVLVAGVGIIGAMGLNEFLKLLVGPIDFNFIPIEFNSVSNIIYESELYFAKGKQRICDTGLAHETDEEVIRKSRDKPLPSKERERYISEAKGREYRNKSKRASIYGIRIKE